jgi:hypothetical protein
VAPAWSWGFLTISSVAHRSSSPELWACCCVESQEEESLAALALRFAQTDTRSPTVFIDELYSRGLQGSTDYVKRGSPRRVNACLKLADGDDAHRCMLSQFQLTPVNQATCSSALCWGEHPISSNFDNYVLNRLTCLK